MNINEQETLDELISGCKKGYSSSYSAIYYRYINLLFSTALRLLSNKHDAEDVVQEGFVSAFKNIENYDSSKSAFPTWLCKIVINKCIDRLRKRKLLMFEIHEEYMEIAEPFESESLGLTDDEAVSTIKTAVATLPVGYKTILCMHIFDGYAYKEIAGMLNISETTCRSQYMRAKKKLQELIKQDKL